MLGPQARLGMFQMVGAMAIDCGCSATFNPLD